MTERVWATVECTKNPSTLSAVVVIGLVLDYITLSILTEFAVNSLCEAIQPSLIALA